MLDLKREYEHMKEDIDAAIRRCLDHQKWILGPEVQELEEKVVEYLGVEHAVGTSSGTDALVLALRALAIRLKGQEYFDRSDQVVTTPFTFGATGDAILRAGATPVFVDIDPVTYNISPVQIRNYLDHCAESGNVGGTKVIGILPAHLYGQPCQMDEIMAIAAGFNLFVVEDCAQAFGASWNGRKTGSIGVCGAFSFFPSKNLGGFGDGGMVCTNDGELTELIRMLITHGGRDKYSVEHIGYNARLDTLQAAILLVKLKYADEFNAHRRRIAGLYVRELRNIKGIVLPAVDSFSSDRVFHQFTVRVLDGRRDAFSNHLKVRGIDSMVYYPVPLHNMKVFYGRCTMHGNMEAAEQASREVLSLPNRTTYEG
jgi:dTDP-4-amino-4,6-dideoxygalactose transaminase